MALSSAKMSISQDKSPSRSPLSPTIIHYRQKYKIPKTSYHSHHHFRKQKVRNRSWQQSPVNSVWEVHKSSNGQIYYYNIVTDRSQWEKPPKEQLSSLIKKKSILSKQTSNNDNELFLNKQSTSSSTTFISHNNINRTNTITTNNHHKRRKDTIKIKSSFKKFRNDKRQTDEIELLTPISPPENEKIQIDLVDPIPTPSNSSTNIFIPLTISQTQQYDHQVLKSFDSKQSIKKQINADLSSMIIQSSLCPSESTINAILQLEHSSSSLSTTTNSNSDHITRYYRAELIEHLLNWPSTQIERETIRLSNEQMRYIIYRLTSLRTDLFTMRLKLQRNRIHLLKYQYILVNQQDLLDKLQLIQSD